MSHLPNKTRNTLKKKFAPKKSELPPPPLHLPPLPLPVRLCEQLSELTWRYLWFKQHGRGRIILSPPSLPLPLISNFRFTFVNLQDWIGSILKKYIFLTKKIGLVPPSPTSCMSLHLKFHPRFYTSSYSRTGAQSRNYAFSFAKITVHSF